MIGEWHAMVQHGFRFARDELEVFVVLRREDGNHIVTLSLDVCAEGLDPLASSGPDTPSLVIDRQLGEALYEALGAALTSVTEPAQAIRRLRTALRYAEERLGGHEPKSE